ncbi:nicotinamidase-related amidase [Larkinella arboricola]|uniref:Nicotinamidase-related amidase n=1 Tax=Larkinella arboricola TaxID=643671 RepID=A0A327WNC9_LARAB|nr:isochorismatase family cysteine hydrolase [Larkinella arboricola]RAJ92484.1 nicotinamidase-related amidase [Larkinella arboricola]
MSEDLHGNVPDSFPVALLIIDMINDLEFPEGEVFLEPATRAAEKIAALKQKARNLNIPVIYANDNFGRWRSDFTEVVEHCLNDGVRGQPLAELLRPDSDDYFVLKPKHSAFYATTLETLLEYLKAKRLIITGLSADVCVLFSASDAYMREFELYIPSDCVASGSAEHTQETLEYVERVLSADTTPSDQLDLGELCRSRE